MSQRSRKKDDPVLYEDFIEFATKVESRLTQLETDQKWVRESLKELKLSVEKIKWWILVGLVSSAALYILSRLVVG